MACVSSVVERHQHHLQSLCIYLNIPVCKAGEMGIGEGMAPSCRAGGSFNSRDAFQQNGHKSSKTTGIYTHVAMKDLRKIKSPLDLMGGGKDE